MKPKNVFLRDQQAKAKAKRDRAQLAAMLGLAGRRLGNAHSTLSLLVKFPGPILTPKGQRELAHFCRTLDRLRGKLFGVQLKYENS